MIHIVNKGYKYIQTQIDDFCGVIVDIVISLKSAEGRKKYEEVFKRKPVEKAKIIKTRILSIFQTKLTEYSGKVIRIIRKCTDIVCGNLRILFNENNNTQKKKTPRPIPIPVDQTKLTDFIDGAIYLLKRNINAFFLTWIILFGIMKPILRQPFLNCITVMTYLPGEYLHSTIFICNSKRLTPICGICMTGD